MNPVPGVLWRDFVDRELPRRAWSHRAPFQKLAAGGWIDAHENLILCGSSGDGRYARLLRALGGVRLLILDDWGLQPLDAAPTPCARGLSHVAARAAMLESRVKIGN